MAVVRRKCFISYHHADQEAVNAFVRRFDHEHDSFIARGLGEEMPGDVINSTNTDYVMAKIRERFLSDSTVTIVLLDDAPGHAATWIGRSSHPCAEVSKRFQTDCWGSSSPASPAFPSAFTTTCHPIGPASIVTQGIWTIPQIRRRW